MAIAIDGNHVTGDVPAGKKLAIYLRDGETEIVDGPAQVDAWRMHRGAELLDNAADVPANIDPPTQAERVDALEALAGKEIVETKVVELRASKE